MRDKIVDILNKEENKKLKAEELKKLLGVSASEELVSFMKSLNELVEEAEVIENNNQEFSLIKHTNFVRGTLDLKERGFGFLLPEDPALDDIFIPSDQVHSAMNKDRVLVHVQRAKSGMRDEGEIKRILERKYTHIIGTFMFRYGMGFIESDDKTIKQDVVVKQENIQGAKKNDKVRAKIINYSLRGKIECVVTEVLGNKNDKGVDIYSKILKYDVDPIFPDEVMKAALSFDRIHEEDLKGRTDLTNDLIVTIDGESAKDFDDAVIVKKLENGHYHLGVHIADVSHYVTEDSILDKEAYHRGTSIYMPGQVIPMLPEGLSNNLCSLMPDVLRLTISCDMEIDEQGKVVNQHIYPSYIQSKARMTYTKVNKILAKDDKLTSEYKDFVPMFYLMKELSDILLKRREQEGSINFESDEAEIILDENGKAVDVKLRERGESEHIIEEFMLKANQTIAEHVYWMNLPFIYRVHEDPKEEKVMRLIKMAKALGFSVKAHKEISNFELQKLQQKIKGTKSEKGISLLMLRSMQKAIYSKEAIGHFGLGFDFYTHFTSPIRRYPDLIVHRLLRTYLFKQDIGMETIEHYGGVLKGIAAQASETERQAVLLEREVVDMKKAEYISKYINKQFNGVVSSVTSFGIYVSLDNSVEGLIHISNLKGDYYVYDPDMMMLVGERTKKTYRVGDELRIKVTNANITEGEVDFVPVKG